MVKVRSNPGIAKGTAVEPMYIYCSFMGCGEKIHTTITSHWLRKHPEAYKTLMEKPNTSRLPKSLKWS